jgi:ABC-type polysaccharide/polyol phosphate export permease
MPRYWAYLLSGMLVYQFISAAIVEGAGAIRRNAGIVRKVYLPLDARLSRRAA